MSTETLDLSPAAILGRAADAIEKRGLAREDYTVGNNGADPDTWPVDLLGGLAAACGFQPMTWITEEADTAAFRPVLEMADLLVEKLALDPDAAYDESLGAWSDDRDADQVVTELRKIAKEVATS